MVEWNRKRLLFLVFIYAASLAVYCGAEFLLKENFDDGHAVAVFAGFFLVPAVALFAAKQKQVFGELKGAYWGLSAYGLFLFWVLAYYFAAPEKFVLLKFANLASAEFVLWNIFTAMNVLPVDYFSKRVVQFEAEALFGAKTAFAAQVAVWCAGHVPEFLWLTQEVHIMGNFGAGAFILFSGIATGLAYWKTKNVWGMMLGHWALNMIIACVVSIFGML